MLTNHGKSDNSSSDVLTIGNNNSMYIHSGGDDYYLPPSAERDDSSVHSGSERNDSMLGSTIPEDIDDDNLGIKEYGSFAPQSKQDFSSPVLLRPPIRFPTPSLPLPPTRPPTLQSSNPRPTSLPPSNVVAASASTSSQQYPSSPSNTFQEFLTGDEYKRPVTHSPYDDSHFHLVDEKTKVKQSSPPKKVTPSTKPTNTSSNSITTPAATTNHTTTSVKSSNGTTTTPAFEPKNNQVGLKTLLAQKHQQQQQQKEDKMETDEKVKENKKEEKVKESKKDEKPKKTPKTITKKKSKKDSDSESEYVDESESDDSDKKPSKKTKKKEKIKKPTKPKPTKKETKKEEEKKETKKETKSSKRDITIPSPKRTLDPSGSENETNGSDEPKSKKNKITSSIIDEPITSTITTKPSVETFTAPVVKTTSQLVKEKLEARKAQTRPNEDPPKKKSETKQTLAKKQKHTADDKMKQKKSSEAISYYLRAGILFSEGAHFSKEAYLGSSKENKQNYFFDAVNLLQQTVAYLKQIAKMALQHGEIQKAALTHLLLFTTVKVWFKLKSETIVKYKNYLMARVNELGGASTGNSQSTSPAVASPQSVSTPSPIHSSMNTSEGIQKKDVEKLCKELDVVSQLAEQEDNLNLQLKNFAVYREDSELMIRVYQGDLMFVTIFIEEELIKLDV